jgi:hypothetical protein
VDRYADGIMSFTANSGNQEARGGGQAMGARYFSGMLEELDAEREFHHDRAAGKLYWAPPSPSTPGQNQANNVSSPPPVSMGTCPPCTRPPVDCRIAINRPLVVLDNMNRLRMDTPRQADGLVVPRLDRLIQVAGSSAATPAKDIVLSGLTLMHSAPTFCCDHPYESISGESKRLVVESPWSQFTSDCQRF